MLIVKHDKKGAFIFTPETEKEKEYLGKAVASIKRIDLEPIVDAAYDAAINNLTAMGIAEAYSEITASALSSLKSGSTGSRITPSSETGLKRYCLEFAQKISTVPSGVSVLDLAEEIYRWITKD